MCWKGHCVWQGLDPHGTGEGAQGEGTAGQVDIRSARTVRQHPSSFSRPHTVARGAQQVDAVEPSQAIARTHTIVCAPATSQGPRSSPSARTSTASPAANAGTGQHRQRQPTRPGSIDDLLSTSFFLLYHHSISIHPSLRFSLPVSWKTIHLLALFASV